MENLLANVSNKDLVAVRVAQTIAAETGIETAILDDLESLSEELQAKNLGYIDAMYENLEALKRSIH